MDQNSAENHQEVSTTVQPDPWGYLIKPDKSPEPRLENLLRAIARHIDALPGRNEELGLTPTKLASFYRSVGGNYDTLFLETPDQSLSFIYQSLGCVHTLQPTDDDFAAPSVPALTPRGFVRWQMIQLLLGPEEFVPYLQEAVLKFDLVDPTTGKAFPRLLPKDSFPDQPDPDMVRWHNAVFESLQRDAQEEMSRTQTNGTGQRTPCNGTPYARDATDYFASHDAYRNPSGRANEAFAAPPGTPYYGDIDQRGPRDKRRRRRSYPEQPFAFTSKGRDVSNGESYQESISTLSDDDQNSMVLSDTSSNGSSPAVHRSRGHRRNRSEETKLYNRRSRRRQLDDDDDLTQSGDSSFSDIDSPRLSSTLPDRPLSSARPSAPTSNPLGGDQGAAEPGRFVPAPVPPAPPRVNYRGANVKWKNENSLWEFPSSVAGGSAASTPGSEYDGASSYFNSRRGSRDSDDGDGYGKLWNGTGTRHVQRDGYGYDGQRGRAGGSRIQPTIKRISSPVLGVDGRRYPAGGILWR